MHRHGSLERLEPMACYDLLRQHYAGRLGYVADDRPVIVPVNYRVDDRGSILFRTGAGEKLLTVRRGAVLALQVDGSDELYHVGWSVLVSGPAEELTAAHDLAAAEDLLLRPWATTAGDGAWIAIRPDRVEGRRLH